MYLQAEQMRSEELRADIELLQSLETAGDSEALEYERGKICQKWSRVEQLSPVPVDIDHVREFIPAPAELLCSETEVGGAGEPSQRSP